MTTPSWQFNEMVHSGIDFADPNEVEAYDQRQRRDPAAAQQLLSDLSITGQDVLLEFGPGTGVLTLEAAKLCRKVYAVDVSSAMLAYIERQARRQGLDNVVLVSKGLLSYQHDDEPVDYVVSQFAFHHLPDFWKVQALVQTAELLKPGGTFYMRDVVFSFESHECAQHVESRRGSTLTLVTRATAGRGTTSRGTFGKSTAPIAGYSRRCSSAPASRLSRSSMTS